MVGRGLVLRGKGQRKEGSGSKLGKVLMLQGFICIGVNAITKFPIVIIVSTSTDLRLCDMYVLRHWF